MEINELRQRYPDIDVETLFPFFPRLPVSSYPELKNYSWAGCHRDFMGGGGLFLVADLVRTLGLEPGMRVLDLACGHCASSIFLAKAYAVDVVAIDHGVNLLDNQLRVQRAGLAGKIRPMQMDARDLRLPVDHFDAIFCLNSYFYFGIDDGYLPYLLQILRQGGRLGIASPCYARTDPHNTGRISV